MSYCIVKLTDAGQKWFLVWSNDIAAPVTYGMTREELDKYVAGEYQTLGFYTDDVMRINRAGRSGSWLSLEQIIDTYVRRRPLQDGDPEPELPLGKMQ